MAWDYIRHKYPLENETLKAEVASLKCLGGASFKSHHFFIESFLQILPQEKNESRRNLGCPGRGICRVAGNDASWDILNEERTLLRPGPDKIPTRPLHTGQPFLAPSSSKAERRKKDSWHTASHRPAEGVRYRNEQCSNLCA